MEKKKYEFEAVHIRKRKLAGGKWSLYLDIVKDDKRSRENLGLYLEPETDRWAKQRNKVVMQVAEEKKAQRLVEVMREGLHLPDENKGRVVLVEWFKEQQEYYASHGNKNYSKTIHNLIRQLGLCGKKGMRLKDVTPNFLREFLEHLRSDGANKYGGRLCPETIYTYFTVFSILMNKAVRLEMIPANPFHKLAQADKPQRRSKKREYLTVDELQRLAKAECDDWRVKWAFMFCCFTGLRYVDVSHLKWGQIVTLGNGEQQIELTQVKTHEPVYVPISDNAKRWLPERGDAGSANNVYEFHDRSCMYKYLRDWGSRAGVEKHMIFHMSRHTCATLLLYYGADLYTVSKILGHTSIKSTQVYAKVVDEVKRKAVDQIPKLEV